jgi:hypothetical protein
VVAVLAPVLHHAGPGPAGLQRGPQVAKASSGMSGWRTRLCGWPISSVAAVAAGGDERRVAVGDAALEVGDRHQGQVRGQGRIRSGKPAGWFAWSTLDGEMAVPVIVETSGPPKARNSARDTREFRRCGRPGGWAPGS